MIIQKVQEAKTKQRLLSASLKIAEHASAS